jgi:hypothetical protein
MVVKNGNERIFPTYEYSSSIQRTCSVASFVRGRTEFETFKQGLILKRKEGEGYNITCECESSNEALTYSNP